MGWWELGGVRAGTRQGQSRDGTGTGLEVTNQMRRNSGRGQSWSRNHGTGFGQKPSSVVVWSQQRSRRGVAATVSLQRSNMQSSSRMSRCSLTSSATGLTSCSPAQMPSM